MMKYKFMIKMLSGILITVVAISLVACSTDKTEDKKVETKIEGRWYTNLQVDQGKEVFIINCSGCHGSEGQSLVEDWKKSLPDGSYPAPPLNGTAHTWHHGKEQLLRTINNGGIPIGGKMPAFKDKLTDKQKESVMAYFMSLWPDQIYQAWEVRNTN